MAVFPALFGMLMASLVTAQTDQLVEITPKEAVVRVNSNISIIARVNYPIDSCGAKIQKASYRILESLAQGDVIYSGRGFQNGECGIEIKRVTEDMNGDVTLSLPVRNGGAQLIDTTMKLIVAKAPSKPILDGSVSTPYLENNTLDIMCKVSDGRPAASISWFLGEEQIVEGLYEPMIENSSDSGVVTIMQRLTRKLTSDDDQKMLKCRAEHVAYDSPQEASMQLLVFYPPRLAAGESTEMTIFGLKIGEEGRLNVSVRASPPIRAMWTVRGETLIAPQTNAVNNVTALAPENLGNGKYNVTLLLHRVAKEDVEQTYYLQVGNDHGALDVKLKISTMDEPAGVELGAGAIVGIVVAVLALLIAVFLVVFAKATDRWCFGAGGRGRDHTKSSGESTPAGDVLIETGNPMPSRTSDTESAVGGRERSRLANLTARVMAALPRAKDKVQATEAAATEAEEKPLSEDKKGVVYAELVLSEQPSAEKPQPASTEYAEIVYTDQPQQQKEAKE